MANSSSSSLQCGTGVEKRGRDIRSESMVHILLVVACMVFATLSETVLIVMTFLGVCIVFIPELHSSFNPRFIVNRVTADADGITLSFSHSAFFCAMWQNVAQQVPWSQVKSIDAVAEYAGESQSSADLVLHLLRDTIAGRRLAVDSDSYEAAQRCAQAMRHLKECARQSEAAILPIHPLLN